MPLILRPTLSYVPRKEEEKKNTKTTTACL